MAQPFLGRGHQARPPPLVRPQVADSPRRRSCTASFARPQLARQRQQQFVLPVARHPGDAQDLALAHGKADVLQRGAERDWASATDSPVTSSATAPFGFCAARRRGQRLRPPSVSASSRADLLARRAGGHHLAPPQDRRRIAERSDLLQLVADVQDRRAFGRQLAAASGTGSPPPAGSAPMVGSSMISSFGSCSRQRMISTRCRSPARQVAHQPVGVQRQAVFLGSPRGCARPARRIGGGFSIPSATFSATFSASNRLKCWNTIATPCRRATLGLGGRIGRAAQRHRARCRACTRP